MEFRGDPEILAIFRDAGAGVDGERVRFEPGMCRRIIRASAPREFAQHARNPREHRHHRRQPHRALPLVGSALRARPRCGAALRHPRRLPQAGAESTTRSPTCTTPGASSASRSTSPPPRATSTCSTITSATPTALHGRVPRGGGARRTRWTWRRSCRRGFPARPRPASTR